MKAHKPIGLLRDERGFTLIELLVSMIIGLVVTLAAFAMLEFTTSDVSLTTERAHLTQTGRVALQNIMLQLHSACVSVNVHPIKSGSNENELKLVSETSPLNSYNEPTSSLSTVRLHKIIYSKIEETLTEKSWPSSGTPPTYAFNESETPTKRLLLKGVRQSTNEKGETIPVFQYYRYYKEGDTIPKEDTTLPYGELNPVTVSTTKLKEEAQAEQIAKVAVSFTLAPEGKESVFAKGYRPVALEDSAVLRLAPSSEAASNTNLPCTQQT